MAQVTQNELIGWVRYWNAGAMGPNFGNVHTFDDMVNCRRFNPCMQGGIMWNVTDLQMWEALCSLRAGASA